MNSIPSNPPRGEDSQTSLDIALANASDAFLLAVVQDAELPALLPALAQATGDKRLLADDLRPQGGPIGAVPRPQSGMSLDAIAKARLLAFEALKDLRDGKGTALDLQAEPQALSELMGFMTGELSQSYLPLLKHELNLVGDIGALDVDLSAIAQQRDFKVVVIGAGMSGIGMTYRLKQAGLNVTTFETADDVGGTWYKNSYPGCRLDTPNYTYSYSFQQKNDWPQAFTEQKHLRKYFADSATALGVREHVRFKCEVTKLVYDEAAKLWTVTWKDAEGAIQQMTANAVVSAVGQLNQPNIPQLDGIDSFKGDAFHTAQWRHDVDVTGKKVVVIGTGASAFQVIPTIKDHVAQMTVFMRTPPWMYPAADYHADVAFGMRWLLKEVPHLNRWYRFLQFYTNLEGRLRYMRVEKDWQHPVSVGPENDELRLALQGYIEEQFADRPDLLPYVVPQYPPGAKRMLRDNGIWAGALKSPNVNMVPHGISHVVENGVVDREGVLHEADIIIYGTGFKASDFLMPMQVTGRGGVDLHQRWEGDLQAYYGVCTPEFPNLFMLYGPNTNLVINGSLVFLQEMGMEFVTSLLSHLLQNDLGAVEVRADAFAEHNAWLEEGNAGLAWGAASVSSWYKSRTGRVTQNWPYSMLDYWQGTHDWDPAKFIFD